MDISTRSSRSFIPVGPIRRGKPLLSLSQEAKMGVEIDGEDNSIPLFRTSQGPKMKQSSVFVTPTTEPKDNNDLIAKHWSTDNQGNYWAAAPVVNTMDAGMYGIVSTQQGLIYTKLTIKTDDLIPIPGTPTQAILNEVMAFWDKGELFKSFGFMHKRAFILWGPTGTGKSSIIAQIVDKFCTEKNGIAIYGQDPNALAAALAAIRRVEPDRPILVILEDFESLLASYRDGPFLSLLDGESQVDKIFFIATTNYPEQIPPRFRDRPSRFDTLFEVGSPNAEARKAYFKAKYPSLPEDQVDVWVTKSEGLSFGHLKEIVVATQCFNMNIDDVVAKFNTNLEVKTIERQQSSRLGFNS